MEKQPQYFKEGQTAWWLKQGQLIEGIIYNNISNRLYPFFFNPLNDVEVATFTYDGRINSTGSVCLFQKHFPIPQNVPLTDGFQVGDRVKCKVRGIGTVKYIETDARYPVKVEFDNYLDGKYNYTLEGKFSTTDYEPILTKI